MFFVNLVMYIIKVKYCNINLFSFYLINYFKGVWNYYCRLECNIDFMYYVKLLW